MVRASFAGVRRGAPVRWLCVTALWLAGPAPAATVPVRSPEGATYSLVSLHAPDGKRLADGELVQTMRAAADVESRLRLLFADGSRYDEVAIFSQHGTFRLLSYSLEEGGPAFDETQEISFDRASSRYRARIRSRDGKEERDEGTVDIPDDVYNGMAGILIRNTGGQGQAHQLVFTPKPQLLDLVTEPAGVDQFTVGGTRRDAKRYRLRIRVAGLKGWIAPLVGKDPPDVYFWFAESAPGFLKFEGPLYLRGPVWRIEPAPPRWVRH